jgi:hypothetical protein
MNKLPNVFASPINKKLNNYQDLYRSDSTTKSYNPKDINKKINEIFGSLNHVYKSRVRITMNDGIIEEQIVGKTNINLLTIDNKLIKITDILDIEKI